MLNTTQTSEVLRPKQLASILNVSRSTIQNMLRDKKIKSFRISDKSQGIYRSDLDAYIAQQQANELSV
jgi:excisionase family DNA binding protein